jgi:hypothetical protein
MRASADAPSIPLRSRRSRFSGHVSGRLKALDLKSQISNFKSPIGTRRRLIAGAALVLAIAAGSPRARADALWNLTTSDFHTSSAALVGISADAVHVTSASGEDQTVSLDQLLELSRPLPPRSDGTRYFLILQDGDRIGGDPVAIVGEQIEWQSPALGDLRLPLRQLVAIAGADQTISDDRPREDVVSLANGDSVHGLVTALGAGKVAVQTSNGNTDVPLGAVASIEFAAVAGRSTPRQGFRIRLDDGTSVMATLPSLDGDLLRFTIPGNPPGGIELAQVAAIEQVNGPVSWLSLRPPSESVYIPYIGSAQSWPARMDHSVTGGVLRFKEQTFSHGIGVHAYSRLTWPLDGSWSAFRTRYAIDGNDPDALAADVTVRIKLDGHTVYEQPHVHGGVLSPVIVENLAGAKSLTLEADFGDRMDTRARLNWIEPALLKHAPATQPAGD